MSESLKKLNKGKERSASRGKVESRKRKAEITKRTHRPNVGKKRHATRSGTRVTRPSNVIINLRNEANFAGG
jgi:ribosomal protein L28